MIVDDEPDLREMVNLMLSKEGFKTEMAEDGTDFLEKVDNFKPDLVTLDVMMPGLTTSEILDKLKNKQSDPKIILLTVVRYSNEERERILKMGNIVDYITKPFDFDKLIFTIQKHVIKTIAPS
jgi:DNA-binding response OmpR family regulator